jgi:hypothetical protein
VAVVGVVFVACNPIDHHNLLGKMAAGVEFEEQDYMVRDPKYVGMMTVAVGRGRRFDSNESVEY